MNILYAMGNNYAGLAWHYLEYINTKTQHRARAFLRRHRREVAATHSVNAGWYDPATMPIVHIEELPEALAWADVVHCLHSESPLTLNAASLVRKKRWFYGWIGMVCSRQHLDMIFPDGIPMDGSVRFTHDDHGHDQYEPFASLISGGLRVTRIPWLMDTTHTRFAPGKWDEKIAQVGMFVHVKAAPNLPDGFGGLYTAALPRVWSDKGAGRVGEILSGLPFVRNAADMPWLQMLAARRRCQLGIDEMISPCWNLAGIEFLALGVPCLNCVNDYTIDTMRDVLGAPSPWLRCDWNTLRASVEGFFSMPDTERKLAGDASRAWVERYYNPATVWQMYEELYNGR